MQSRIDSDEPEVKWWSFVMDSELLPYEYAKVMKYT